MSNYYPVNKSYGDKKDCNQECGHNQDHHYDKGCYDHHNRVDCKPNKTILRCKETCGTSISVVIPAAGGTVTTDPTVIGTISVKDLCCFKNPCVKLDVSSVVSDSATDDAVVTLQYQISRRCDVERDFRVIKTITALAIEVGTTPGTVPVSLSICDCEDFCRRYSCCDYEVAIIATVTGVADTVVTINPNYTSLSVVAGEGNC